MFTTPEQRMVEPHLLRMGIHWAQLGDSLGPGWNYGGVNQFGGKKNVSTTYLPEGWSDTRFFVLQFLSSLKPSTKAN